MWLYSLIRF